MKCRCISPQTVEKVAESTRFYRFECFFVVVNDSSTIIIAGRITTNIVRKSPFFTDITAILCFCQLELGVYRDKNNQG